MALPDFLVAGVPKSGTTALHAALSRHPAPVHVDGQGTEVLPDRRAAARPGRPGRREDLPGARLAPTGLRGAVRPGPAGLLRGESTPFYLYNRAAQRRIRALVPAAKLIVVLRDPVERAHSNWTHLWSAGLDPVGDFVQACARGGAADRGGLGRVLALHGAGPVRGAAQHLYTLFPRDQVLVFRYRAMIERPAADAGPDLRVPGRPPGVLTEMPRENVTAHPDPTLRHRAVAKALRAGHQVAAALPGHAGSGLIDRLERILQQDAAPRRPLTWEERQALIPRFEADIALLESVTGEDFGDWLAPRGDSGGLVGARPSGQRQARNGRPR